MDPVKVMHIHSVAPTKTEPIDVVIIILALIVATALGSFLTAVYINRTIPQHKFHLYRAIEIESSAPFILVLKGEKGYGIGDNVRAIHDTITTAEDSSAVSYKISDIIEDKD